jgi:hypothetical protein
MNEEFLDQILLVSHFVMIMKRQERIHLHDSASWIVNDGILRNTNRVVSSHVMYEVYKMESG